MKVLTGLVLFAFLCSYALAEGEEQQVQNEEQDVKVEPEQLEYAKGSLCGYCDYCKFCKLCDADCPCDPAPTRPNCHMCKYCKYCYLCSSLCDTICQPGGFLDRASAALVNALPSVNRDEVDKDIDGVKDWVDKLKEEL